MKFKKHITKTFVLGVIVGCISFYLILSTGIISSRAKDTHPFLHSTISENKVDSVMKMSYDVEEIIEQIFSNQGYKLPLNTKFRKASNNNVITEFEESAIFFYISPLICWSCVKSINEHLASIADEFHIIYLIPDHMSLDITPFLDYSKIPINDLYYLSTDLGLPIEELNIAFFFTIKNQNLISNVFPPTKYSKELTEAYINIISTN